MRVIKSLLVGALALGLTTRWQSQEATVVSVELIIMAGAGGGADQIGAY